MGNPFNRHWLMVGALWAVLGCAAGFFAAENGWQAPAVIACACFAAASAAGWILKKPSYFVIRGLFALLGMLWFFARTGPLNAEQPFEGKIVGRICALPEPLEYGVKTVLDDVWVEEAGGWRKVSGRVSLLSDVSGAEYGDTGFGQPGSATNQPEPRRVEREEQQPGGRDFPFRLGRKRRGGGGAQGRVHAP